MQRQRTPTHLDWLEPVKALALLAILLNHLVEQFSPGSWFTVPRNNWSDFATRMSNVLPEGDSVPIRLLVFLGWLGESAPGVFILLSGLGLTWSMLQEPAGSRWVVSFFQRRLLRIFPLYVAMHFVILAGCLLVPTCDASLGRRATLLSLFGLRFTEDLFFYISPAWWFIWLILQLYLVFPILYLLLIRVGIPWFLVFTCAFTFVSRSLGLIYSPSVSYWMTGIFFGTRLDEFCVGMVIAAALYRPGKCCLAVFPARTLLAGGTVIYIGGLVCSWTWWGSVVSNILVTVGMTGLFYAAWQGFLKGVPLLATTLEWVGLHAYAVFLLHHTPLIWTVIFFQGDTAAQGAAAVLILALCFPLAWLIEMGVSKLQTLARDMKGSRALSVMSYSVAFWLLTVLLSVELQRLTAWGLRAVSLMLGLGALLLVCADCVGRMNHLREGPGERYLRWSSVVAVFCQLYLFPSAPGWAAVMSASIVTFVPLMVCHYWKPASEERVAHA